MGAPPDDVLAAFCSSNRSEEAGGKFTHELRQIVELSAQSGKYWHDWRLLKQLLHFRMNQVIKQLHSSADTAAAAAAGGESEEKALYDVINRLGQQLCSFSDAAPFTLQRICELLLAAPRGYSSLDKFELAFEKLLLVTSTFPPSEDPYPAAIIANNNNDDNNNNNNSNSSNVIVNESNNEEEGTATENHT